jgi:uncharacterized protein (TIGR00299 family) protein
MNFLYFDGSSGMSGDMILGALLDLGVSHELFQQKMAGLKLPVTIRIHETKRSNLRGLKVDVDVSTTSNKVTRKWKDVEGLIQGSPFSDKVKDRSLSIFKRLFQAEGRVHGRTFNQTHLHEAGADDAIIDILGCCFLFEALKIDTFYSSPLNIGRGWIECSHGRLPVPPPAVGELLKKIPVYSAGAEKEMVTPTGAAIISTITSTFIPFPEMVYERIGYGAGSLDFPELPNILRVFLGKKERFNPAKKVFIIEANIDDCSPQLLAGYFETAFKLGALDVSLTPIVMKKNRLATHLTVLTRADKLDSIIESIFKETSTIGVRFYPVERRVLDRSHSKVTVLGKDIAIKTASLGNEVVNALPEYEDCLKVAKRTGLPLKRVEELARSEHIRSLKRKETQKRAKK